MAENKTEEVEETTGETQATDETIGASNADTNETSAEAQATAGTEEKSESDSSILGGVLETVSSAVGSVAEAVVSGVETVVATVTGDESASDDTERKHGKRAEKIGVVASDKMTKTVVVRVDRLVKHPIYRKYIRRKKKFMAHDDFGAAIGDKVRIVETRPMSARKRWRVAEIIQKAVK
jgi:small subunit ribosomal protein S17